MLARLKFLAVVGAALAIGLTAVPVDAQVQATVVTKSGERHTGTGLGYRIDGREVALRVSFSEAPRIPVDQVAYVEFGGGGNANVNLSGSEQALVLRDGSVRKGQVIELGHGDRANEQSPYLIIFKADNGEELRLPPDRVARVYFSGGGSSSSASTAGGSERITLPGTEQWKGTGINLARGDRVTVSAIGEIRLGGDPDDSATPAGGSQRRLNKGNPLPNVPTGALIGRIGNGGPFLIGSSRTISAPAPGELFIGINDSYMQDNRGDFQIQIRRDR
jgi:hypothetical protein